MWVWYIYIYILVRCRWRKKKTFDKLSQRSIFNRDGLVFFQAERLKRGCGDLCNKLYQGGNYEREAKKNLIIIFQFAALYTCFWTGRINKQTNKQANHYYDNVKLQLVITSSENFHFNYPHTSRTNQPTLFHFTVMPHFITLYL